MSNWHIVWNLVSGSYVVGTQKNCQNETYGSFKHQKHIFKMIGKEIISILRYKILYV